MKQKYVVKALCNSTPDQDGWLDLFTLDHYGERLFTGLGSTCPNPSKNGVHWRNVYGWIAKGVYDLETIVHPKYGKCCLINGGTTVDARYPNVNNNNDKILIGMFIHEGNRNCENPLWRGSAGCPTLPPNLWREFVKVLPEGKGVLIVE